MCYEVVEKHKMTYLTFRFFTNRIFLLIRKNYSDLCEILPTRVLVILSLYCNLY